MTKPTAIGRSGAARPQTFTSREAFLEELRSAMWASGQSWSKLAERSGVASSTIHNLASGKTGWPRPKTLFSLISVLGLGLRLAPVNQKGFQLLQGGKAR